MKFSKYNFYFSSNENYLMYNCASDNVLLIESKLMDLCKRFCDEPEKLGEIAPPFYQKLIQKGYVVEVGTDEANQIVEKWAKEDCSQRDYTITINPTMSCNLKCWYCYEKHRDCSVMSPAVLESSIKFIKDKVEKYDYVSLSFFGGEPLLCFDDVARPILDSLRAEPRANNARVYVHFTTNATLLDNNMVKYIKQWTPSFQIAIDGNESSHNKVKFFNKSNSATYRLILNNIKMLLDNKIHVGLRCNYTSRTLPHFFDVLSDIKDWSSENKKYLSVSFSRIWQDKQGDFVELEKNLIVIEKEYRKHGFQVNGHLSQGVKRCYADKENSIVINYDGNVYKCTARDFCKSNREGTLNQDGTVSWNETYLKRLVSRYDNVLCKECNIFPICRGGCSQSKLENITNSCVRGYSDIAKRNFVQQRILEIYRKMNFLNTNF